MNAVCLSTVQHSYSAFLAPERYYSTVHMLQNCIAIINECNFLCRLRDGPQPQDDAAVATVGIHCDIILVDIQYIRNVHTHVQCTVCIV